MQYAIGVDLGGTKTAAGVVNGSGEVLFQETIPTLNRSGGEAILDATAGLVSRLGLPAGAVRAVNDVHAHALGEAWAGAAAGSSTSLLVAFGTGVGGSFVVAGRPVLGHRYVGGHVGHFASPYAYDDGTPLPCVCGGYGHVEAVASGPAIHETYLRLGSDAAAADTRAVFARAGGGDVHAVRAVELAAAAAGQALGGLANILDPQILVVSGGLADAGPAWWMPMEQALRAELLPALVGIPVLRPALGNAAAIIGAASLVLHPSPVPTYSEATQ